MSQQGGALDLTFTSAADLRTKQYFIVRVSAAQTVNLAITNTPAGMIGVLQNEPNTGEAAVVRVLGATKVSCGTPVGVAFSDRIGPDTNGQARAVTTDKYAVLGFALEAASTAVGDIKEMIIAIHMISVA